MALGDSVLECQSTADSPVVAFVAKLLSVPRKDVTFLRDGPQATASGAKLTEDEVKRKRDMIVARLKIVEL